MNKVQIHLSGNAEVYKNASELFTGFKDNAPNTKTFRKAMEDFFESFNQKYNSKVSFEDILNIYEKKRSTSLRESIILCKALLDFIQNHSLEVSFHGKTYLLKFATLANINVILEYNPTSDDQRLVLQTLAGSISGFIAQIREYFRMIIGDNLASLESANVDEYFFAISGIVKSPPTVEIVEETGVVAVPVAPTSVKISDSLVLPFNISDTELSRRIQSLDNAGLVAFLDYIYERIPFKDRTGRKHVDIAQVVFKTYASSLGQTIERVLNQGTRLRSDSIAQFDFGRIRKMILHPQLEIGTTTEVPVANALTINGNLLTLRDGVTIQLQDDESTIQGIIDLEAEDVQIFFGFLEDIARKKLQITGSVTKELATMIQISEDKNLNIYQKITNLRREPSTVTRKFLNNNINLAALKKLILSHQVENTSPTLTGGDVGDEIIPPSDGDKGIDDLKEKGASRKFQFTFKNDEEEEVKLEVEGGKGKNKEAFISALNSLIAQESKRQDVEGFIDPFTLEDFEGIELDTSFFTVIQREKTGTKLSDIFEVLSEDVLEAFLKFWHVEVGARLKESKKIFIVPGSREELFDFVFNVWQEKLNAIVRKEIRKSGTTRAGHVDRRRRSSTLTEAMFAGIESLTQDTVSKLPAAVFQQIFSRTPKKEVEQWVREYISSRKSK